jgi:hypothetical protein
MPPDEPAVYCLCWPDLRLLTELPGPEWRLSRPRPEALCLVRAFETFVETALIAADGLVVVNRRPIPGRTTPRVADEDFAGALVDAVEVLRRPPRAAPTWPAQEIWTPTWPRQAAI